MPVDHLPPGDDLFDALGEGMRRHLVRRPQALGVNPLYMWNPSALYLRGKNQKRKFFM